MLGFSQNAEHGNEKKNFLFAHKTFLYSTQEVATDQVSVFSALWVYPLRLQLLCYVMFSTPEFVRLIFSSDKNAGWLKVFPQKRFQIPHRAVGVTARRGLHPGRSFQSEKILCEFCPAMHDRFKTSST